MTTRARFDRREDGERRVFGVGGSTLNEISERDVVLGGVYAIVALAAVAALDRRAAGQRDHRPPLEPETRATM